MLQTMKKHELRRKLQPLKIQVPQNPVQDSLEKSNSKEYIFKYIYSNITNIVNDYINPALSEHDGRIEIKHVDVKPSKIILEIDYKGTCSQCASSTTETLSMIEGLLNEELQELFGKKIVVNLPQEYMARANELKEYSLIG